METQTFNIKVHTLCRCAFWFSSVMNFHKSKTINKTADWFAHAHSKWTLCLWIRQCPLAWVMAQCNSSSSNHCICFERMRSRSALRSVLAFSYLSLLHWHFSASADLMYGAFPCVRQQILADDSEIACALFCLFFVFFFVLHICLFQTLLFEKCLYVSFSLFYYTYVCITMHLFCIDYIRIKKTMVLHEKFCFFPLAVIFHNAVIITFSLFILHTDSQMHSTVISFCSFSHHLVGFLSIKSLSILLKCITISIYRQDLIQFTQFI